MDFTFHSKCFNHFLSFTGSTRSFVRFYTPHHLNFLMNFSSSCMSSWPCNMNFITPLLFLLSFFLFVLTFKSPIVVIDHNLDLNTCNALLIK